MLVPRPSIRFWSRTAKDARWIFPSPQNPQNYGLPAGMRLVQKPPRKIFRAMYQSLRLSDTSTTRFFVGSQPLQLSREGLDVWFLAGRWFAAVQSFPCPKCSIPGPESWPPDQTRAILSPPCFPWEGVWDQFRPTHPFPLGTEAPGGWDRHRGLLWPAGALDTPARPPARSEPTNDRYFGFDSSSTSPMPILLTSTLFCSCVVPPWLLLLLLFLAFDFFLGLNRCAFASPSLPPSPKICDLNWPLAGRSALRLHCQNCVFFSAPVPL